MILIRMENRSDFNELKIDYHKGNKYQISRLFICSKTNYLFVGSSRDTRKFPVIKSCGITESSLRTYGSRMEREFLNPRFESSLTDINTALLFCSSADGSSVIELRSCKVEKLAIENTVLNVDSSTIIDELITFGQNLIICEASPTNIFNPGFNVGVVQAGGNVTFHLKAATERAKEVYSNCLKAMKNNERTKMMVVEPIRFDFASKKGCGKIFVNWQGRCFPGVPFNADYKFEYPDRIALINSFVRRKELGGMFMTTLEARRVLRCRQLKANPASEPLRYDFDSQPRWRFRLDGQIFNVPR